MWFSDQERMCKALRRLNVPEKVTGHIKSLYESPRFRVVTSEGTSKYHRQSTGIRQGCPLSPYLFILLMTVMFSDIHERINPQLYKKKGGVIDGLNITEMLYADDTLLVLKDHKSASKLLQEVEKESRYYNMKLNEDKCECIAMNHNKQVQFTNGTLMKNVESGTYLVGILTKKGRGNN